MYQAETIKSQQHVMRPRQSEINAFYKRKKSEKPVTSHKQTKYMRCSAMPSHERYVSPAREARCSNCKTLGNYGSECLKKENGHKPGSKSLKNIKALEIDNDENEKKQFLGAVTVEVKNKWQVMAFIIDARISFKVDTGADVTVIGKKLYDDHFSLMPLRPPKNAFQGPDSCRLISLGYFVGELHKG